MAVFGRAARCRRYTLLEHARNHMTEYWDTHSETQEVEPPEYEMWDAMDDLSDLDAAILEDEVAFFIVTDSYVTGLQHMQTVFRQTRDRAKTTIA